MTDETTDQPPNGHDTETLYIGGKPVILTPELGAICSDMAQRFQDYCSRQLPWTGGFKFGENSLDNLHGVYPPLALLASHALTLTTQDFGVTDGMRTDAEQVKLVAKGVSRTLHSMHLPQADGYSHAVDLVPFHGAYSWDWDRIYSVAAVMHRVAMICNVGHLIRWGGAWDRRLSDFGDQPADFQQGVKAYAARHAGSDLLDGPHFEWVIG